MRHWQALAASSSLGPCRSWQHGEFVFHGGESVQNAYVLTEGVVEVLHLLEDGRSLVVKLLVAPSFFGLIEVVGGEGWYLESARCLGPAAGYEVASTRLRSFASGDSKLAMELLADTCQTFCQTAKAEPGRVFGTETLLANLLISYGELFGAHSDAGLRLDVARTQVDFANAVGASERQIQRLLTAWKEAAIVAKIEGSYVIQDQERLREIAGPLVGSLIHRFQSV